MADTRILHRNLSGSEKVNALTHLEFRVWVEYILWADDFGVMRASASMLRAHNIKFETEPTKRLEAAMGRIESLHLVAVFLHQGQRFWWQRDWQDYQQIRYPRNSINPVPSPELLGDATEATRELFTKKRNVSECAPVPARARTREELTLKQTPTLTPELTPEPGDENPPPAPPPVPSAPAIALVKPPKPKGVEVVPEAFLAFWARYPNRKGKQDAIRSWTKLAPDETLVAAIHAALDWQIKQPQWLKDGGAYAPHPSTWLNNRRWEDEPFESPLLDDPNAEGWESIAKKVGHGDR